MATEPGLTLANPVVAVVWGLLLFGEQARTGPWLIGSVLGAAMLVIGTLLLARSPILRGSQCPSSGDRAPLRPARPRGRT